MNDTTLIHPTYKGNIWCTPEQRTDWRIYVTDLCDTAENHIETVDLIRQAGEEDTVQLLITSAGGYIELAEMYLSAMRESKATIVTRAIGQCASAATTIFLNGDVRICEKGSYFMFHNVQGGEGGDYANIRARADFYTHLFRERYYDMMREVLTEEQMAELFDRAGEVFLTCNEMRDRLHESAVKNGGAIIKYGDEGDVVLDEETDDSFDSELLQAVSSALEEADGAGETLEEFQQQAVEEEDTKFVITLEDGYSKTFDLSDIEPSDFDEYSLREVIEIGESFGADLSDQTRNKAVEALINVIVNGDSALEEENGEEEEGVES